MYLYKALATAVLPTGCTTSQGPASSSSRMHDSCSCHIYLGLQRGIFLLPCPLKAMQLKTQFSWSSSYERLQDEPSTQPLPSSHRTSWVLSDGQESWASHGYGRAHTIPPHTHQPTAQPGSRTQPQHPQLGQTPPKPPKLVPDIRHVCKWPAIPQKGKVWNKFVSKRTHDRHPWAVLHFHSTPVHHLWNKLMKISVEQSQSCPPYLAAPAR